MNRSIIFARPKFQKEFNAETNLRDSRVFKKTDYYRVAEKVFYEFAYTTKLNGFYYLRQNNSTGFLRLAWSFVIFLICGSAFALMYLHYFKFIDRPVLMVIHNNETIANIEFPAVTICHPQTVVDLKLFRWINDKKMLGNIPLGVTLDEIGEALPWIGGYIDRRYTSPTRAQMELANQILKMNNITIDEFVTYVGVGCRDMLTKCFWEEKEYDCFDPTASLQWTTTLNYYGVCCTTNFHPLKNENALKTNGFGYDSGLVIVGPNEIIKNDGKSGMIFSDGLFLIVHNPSDYPISATTITIITAGHETIVPVKGTIYSSSQDILNLAQSSRKCISDDGYRQNNCIIDCNLRKIYDICKCHPFNYQKLTGISIRDCQPSDSVCFVESYFQTQFSNCMHCLPSCFDVVYEHNSFYYRLGGLNYSIDHVYDSMNTETDAIDFWSARIFFSNQKVRTSQRIQSLSWIQLISNLGGVFNLGIGISILTLIEFLLYVCIKYPMALWRFRHEIEVDQVPGTRIQVFNKFNQ